MRKFYESPEIEVLSLVSKDIFALGSDLLPISDDPIDGETGVGSSEFD